MGVQRRTLHQGASANCKHGRWGLDNNQGATEEVTGDLIALINRSRTLRRDNAFASRSNQLDHVNFIGTGIKPSPNTNTPTLNTTIRDVLDEWSDTCDFTNSGLDFYGIQKLARQAQHEAGEVFIIHKKLRTDSNMLVPLQIQLLESEFCPLNLHRELTNGNQIVNGIELDDQGRIVAYWFFRNKPNQQIIVKRYKSSEPFIRIRASEVTHLFTQERPNQLRARPRASNSFVTARGFEQYNDAELTRKTTRASLTGTIERENFDEDDYKYNPISGEPLKADDTTIPEFELQSGLFTSLLAGEKLNLFNGDDAGSGYGDFQKFQLMELSASSGVPVELLSGDFSAINDRIWRAIHQQYKRMIEQEQQLIIIPRMVKPLYRAMLSRAVLVDVLPSNRVDLYKANYRAQPFPHIHPEQDINAVIKKLRAGLTTRTEYIEEFGMYGDTVNTIDDQRASDRDSEVGQDLKSLAVFEELDPAVDAMSSVNSDDAQQPPPQPNQDE